MARIPLVDGAYSARSIISSAQRAVNLYAEQNPKSSPSPFTYYPAPGLKPLGTPPVAAQARCLYRSNPFGDLYAVIGNTVYFVNPSWAFTSLGTISSSTGICSMVDNGTTAVLVDSSTNGWQIDLTTRVMTQISAATNAPPPLSGGVYDFNGGTRVDAIDGYILTNDRGTRFFRSTYLNQIIWDSLWSAAKNGFSDNLVAVVVQKREIWLIGEKTTEIWFNAGLTDFPFAIMPGPFVQHGCVAPYSIACSTGGIYWLGQDQNGANICVHGEGYKANAVSTAALVTEWSTYPTTTDAIGFCFQQNDHNFYQLTFPTADKTWRYDENTQQWHEAVWIDTDGAEHRHRANCAAFAYGVNVVGDWETGALYVLDPYTYTDNGLPMVWRRGFPHLMNDGNRAIFPGFTLDAEYGSSAGIPTPPPIIPGTPVTNNTPIVFLRWSDDRGRTWSNPVPQSLGETGAYLTQAQWNRTGMARDRVFEVFGTIPGQFAINGAFLDPEPILLKS